MSQAVSDVVVVGGGIVGLATAVALLERFPSLKLTLLEKESEVAMHQTGHNSGVIHSGIYYRPGSLKAQTCVAGAKLLVEFCQAHHIPYTLCGKLVVARQESELSQLEQLYQRGLANGVPGLTMVGPERMRELEPHTAGIRALHVPQAGIVDYRVVAHTFVRLIAQRGGEIRTAARVIRLLRRERAWVLETSTGEVRGTFLITCGGLHADRLSRMGGAPDDLRIVPFRGDYYELAPERRKLVRAMIYPVPDPALPFLGVHFTRTMEGGVHVGPNAVLALKREGYHKTDISLPDVWGMARYPGFWKMAWRFRAVGMSELYRAWSRAAFTRAAQQLVPEVRSTDLLPSGSGVRAQALNRHGSLVDDFDIVQTERAVHVRNVPSPAATASIRIGRTIAERVAVALNSQ